MYPATLRIEGSCHMPLGIFHSRAQAIHARNVAAMEVLGPSEPLIPVEITPAERLQVDLTLARMFRYILA